MNRISSAIEVERRDDRRARARLVGIRRRRVGEELPVEVRRSPSRKTSTSSAPSVTKPTTERRRAGDELEGRPRASGASAPGRTPHSYTSRYLRTSRIENDVHHQRRDEQRQADGEDRLVLDRAGRHVAGAGRGDEGRHRLDGVARVRGRGSAAGPAASEHDHRLADGARDREHEATRRSPRSRPGRRPASTPAAWSSRARRRRRGARCGTAVIASSESEATVGISITPMTRPAAERVEDVHLDAEVAQERRHERQREVAEDDGRDPGQDLERRLEDPARARARVLAQVDRRAEPERHRDEARDQNVTSSVPTTSGRTPKLGRLEERRPVRPGEEVDDRDLAEELDRRHEQRDDDPDRRRDRDERTQAEDALDRRPRRSSAGRSASRRTSAAAPAVTLGGGQPTRSAAATAASKSLFAFVSCSSVSGTNCEPPRRSPSALSSMYSTNASTSGRSNDSCFA